MDYDLQLYGAADEIVPLLIKGELDMAAIPANLAATPYQKTRGGLPAAYERGDALCVSGTAAREGYVADNALFQFDVDLPGTGPDGGIGYVLGHGV